MSIIFKTYTKVLDALMNTRHDISYPDKPAFEIKEQLVSEYNDGILPNSTQHNVPAWTLFGMFLICIPVAGNVIKERTDGCLARIKTIPVNYFQIMSGKVAVYVIICVLQAVVILLMGIYILPMLGLPKLQLANISSFLLISFTFCICGNWLWNSYRNSCYNTSSSIYFWIRFVSHFSRFRRRLGTC